MNPRYPGPNHASRTGRADLAREAKRSAGASRWAHRLKNGVRADLRAVGTPVIDRLEREAVFSSIIEDLNQPWNPAGIRQPVEPLDQLMNGSPLASVRFVDGESG